MREEGRRPLIASILSSLHSSRLSRLPLGSQARRPLYRVVRSRRYGRLVPSGTSRGAQPAVPATTLASCCAVDLALHLLTPLRASRDAWRGVSPGPSPASKSRRDMDTVCRVPTAKA